MKIVLSTFPRSGSHLLKQYLDQMLDYHITKTHTQVSGDDYFVVTMIRNPEDTLVSLAAMRTHTGEAEPDLDLLISRYILFYKYIIEKANLIIDYEFMLNNPGDVVIYFAQMMNLSINDVKVTNNYVDDPATGYLVTSTTSPQYEKMRELINSYDLSGANSLYEEAKSLAKFK